MPRNVCCVPGCPIVAEDGIPLHYFPNPEKEAVKFQNWIKSIGGGIASLDRILVYKTQRICRRHFQDVFLYPNNRLCRLAVPSLHLPSDDESVPRISPFIPHYQPSTAHEATLLHANVILDPKSANTVENDNRSLALCRDLFSLSSQPSTSQKATATLHHISTRNVKNMPCRSVNFMPWKQEYQVKKMELRLRRCLKDKKTFRKRYLLAKKYIKIKSF